MADEMLKINSGIKVLDQNIGGLQRNGGFLVSGARDTGKSVFSLQFLKEGLINEEKVALVTEKDPQLFIKMANALEIPIENSVNNNELIIVKTIQQGSGIISNIKEYAGFINSLTELILPFECKRLVIDSAVPFLQIFNPNYIEEGLSLLIGDLKQVGATFILTTRMPATRGALLIKKILEDRLSGSIHLDEHTKESGEVTRKLIVRRMTGLNPPYPVYNFLIKNKTGISITDLNETGLEAPKIAVKSPKSESTSLLFSQVYNDGTREEKKEKLSNINFGEAAEPESKEKKILFSDSYKKEMDKVEDNKIPMVKRASFDAPEDMEEKKLPGKLTFSDKYPTDSPPKKETPPSFQDKMKDKLAEPIKKSYKDNDDDKEEKKSASSGFSFVIDDKK